MTGNERNSLPQVIGSDLIRHMLMPLLLLLAVMCTALLVVTITHKTRLLIAQREKLILERNALDIEWRNLILEENALGDHSRVERIAMDKLHMHYVNPSQDNVVVKQ